jgi:hypothetical protein
MKLNSKMKEMSFVGRCAIRELYRDQWVNGVGDGEHVRQVLAEYRKQKARINHHVHSICAMRGIAF